MNEEIDETEFYHQDFTTASDWEVYVSRIEEIVNQWKIDELRTVDKDSNSILWITKSEKLMFADTEFEFSYHKKIKGVDEWLTKKPLNKNFPKIENSVDLNYDFQFYDMNISNEHSNLHVWYGLMEYFVLSPTGSNGITSESKIKILLSSLYLVVSNLKCELPFFVQIKEKWQQCYLGVHEAIHECAQLRTNFEMVHLRYVPHYCQNLTGLLNLFTSKIMSPVSLGYIISSVQFTFDLNDFGKSSWKQDIFTMESDMLETVSCFNLPFGVTVDPISILHLKATWFNIPSFCVYDTEFISNFEAIRAHHWSVLAKMCDHPVCLLSDCLAEYSNLLTNSSRVYDIYLDYNPLDVLMESKVSNISSILSRTARNSISGNKDASVISEEILVPLLYYLFPDAEQLEPKNPYNLKRDNQQNDPNISLEETSILDLDKECRGFKTCPYDSLLWRFAIVSAILQHSGGGFRAFAQLWFEFVQEMRYRWEKNIIISGLIKEFPDLRTCLLNQKLQMLNCCIERKKAREEHQKEFVDYESAEGSSTDDEFFDCADKPNEEMRKIQPVGRLSKFQNLKLIETGEYLYIPKTQEPVPKTEDQLDEDADVLLKLGSDAQGSELRAKLMSASLLSDMESFKAANPGAILEDFVRWYSPRDWIETDEDDQWGQKKGTLSTRMQIEDNIWSQMWKSAKSIPANKQKLLFVDRREAEKVLHYLESRTVAQVCELLTPILLQASIYRLAQEVKPLDVELGGCAKLQNLIKLSERITRESKIPVRRVEAIVQEMAQLELNVSTVNSLHYKFNPCGHVVEGLKESVRDLVKGKEVEIDKNSEISDRITTLFSDAQKNANLVREEDNRISVRNDSVFTSPSVREYVMRIDAIKPALYSAKCPQYLRVIIAKEDFRMVGAFSEDISFF